nr:AmpI [Beauveria felina]
MVRDVNPAALASLLMAAPASASIIFAASYNDHSVTALNLEGSSLTTVATSYDCGSEPTWLTLDHSKKILYCLNEGWGGEASITSYRTNADTASANLETDTSTFGTFSVGDPTALGLLHNETYTLDAPGPVPDRQEVPHLHQSILDPTKRFIVVPDLGADLIRIYKIESGSTGVTAVEPIPAVPGSGPRHGAFSVIGNKIFFYTVNELSNTITGYRVDYEGDSDPEFTQLFDFSTHGPDGSVPEGTKASEIVVSEDQRYVIVSSRGENLLTVPNFDTTNSTALPSDPLITFSVDMETGMLDLVQVAPAGGRNPRGFTLNKSGTLVASALQDDNRVVIIERHSGTGLLGDIVAHATVGVGENNGPNFVLFNEMTTFALRAVLALQEGGK